MLKEFFSKQLATVSDRSIHWQEARIRVLTAPLDHSQFTKLLISCWAIWSARRRAIHEGEFQSPLSTLGFINSYLNELGKVSMVARPVGGRCVTGPSGWTPPPPGVVKIHVDGAVARAGLGAVSAFYFIMVHILGCYPA
jgi:hypothetical protein